MDENAARKLVSSLSYKEKIALMEMLERLQKNTNRDKRTEDRRI